MNNDDQSLLNQYLGSSALDATSSMQDTSYYSQEFDYGTMFHSFAMTKYNDPSNPYYGAQNALPYKNQIAQYSARRGYESQLLDQGFTHNQVALYRQWDTDMYAKATGRGGVDSQTMLSPEYADMALQTYVANEQAYNAYVNTTYKMDNGMWTEDEIGKLAMVEEVAYDMYDNWSDADITNYYQSLTAEGKASLDLSGINNSTDFINMVKSTGTEIDAQREAEKEDYSGFDGFLKGTGNFVKSFGVGFTNAMLGTIETFAVLGAFAAGGVSGLFGGPDHIDMVGGVTEAFGDAKEWVKENPLSFVGVAADAMGIGGEWTAPVDEDHWTYTYGNATGAMAEFIMEIGLIVATFGGYGAAKAGASVATKTATKTVAKTTAKTVAKTIASKSVSALKYAGTFGGQMGSASVAKATYLSLKSAGGTIQNSAIRGDSWGESLLRGGASFAGNYAWWALTSGDVKTVGGMNNVFNILAPSGQQAKLFSTAFVTKTLVDKGKLAIDMSIDRTIRSMADNVYSQTAVMDESGFAILDANGNIQYERTAQIKESSWEYFASSENWEETLQTIIGGLIFEVGKTGTSDAFGAAKWHTKGKTYAAQEMTRVDETMKQEYGDVWEAKKQQWYGKIESSENGVDKLASMSEMEKIDHVIMMEASKGGEFAEAVSKVALTETMRSTLQLRKNAVDAYQKQFKTVVKEFGEDYKTLTGETLTNKQYEIALANIHDLGKPTNNIASRNIKGEMWNVDLANFIKLNGAIDMETFDKTVGVMDEANARTVASVKAVPMVNTINYAMEQTLDKKGQPNFEEVSKILNDVTALRNSQAPLAEMKSMNITEQDLNNMHGIGMDMQTTVNNYNKQLIEIGKVVTESDNASIKNRISTDKLVEDDFDTLLSKNIITKGEYEKSIELLGEEQMRPSTFVARNLSKQMTNMQTTIERFEQVEAMGEAVEIVGGKRVKVGPDIKELKSAQKEVKSFANDIENRIKSAGNETLFYESLSKVGGDVEGVKNMMKLSNELESKITTYENERKIINDERKQARYAEELKGLDEESQRIFIEQEAKAKVETVAKETIATTNNKDIENISKFAENQKVEEVKVEDEDVVSTKAIDQASKPEVTVKPEELEYSEAIRRQGVDKELQATKKIVDTKIEKLAYDETGTAPKLTSDELVFAKRIAEGHMIKINNLEQKIMDDPDNEAAYNNEINKVFAKLRDVSGVIKTHEANLGGDLESEMRVAESREVPSQEVVVKAIEDSKTTTSTEEVKRVEDLVADRKVVETKPNDNEPKKDYQLNKAGLIESNAYRNLSSAYEGGNEATIKSSMETFKKYISNQLNTKQLVNLIDEGIKDQWGLTKNIELNRSALEGLKKQQLVSLLIPTDANSKVTSSYFKGVHMYQNAVNSKSMILNTAKMVKSIEDIDRSVTKTFSTEDLTTDLNKYYSQLAGNEEVIKDPVVVRAIAKYTDELVVRPGSTNKVPRINSPSQVSEAANNVSAFASANGLKINGLSDIVDGVVSGKTDYAILTSEVSKAAKLAGMSVADIEAGIPRVVSLAGNLTHNDYVRIIDNALYADPADIIKQTNYTYDETKLSSSNIDEFSRFAEIKTDIDKHEALSRQAGNQKNLLLKYSDQYSYQKIIYDGENNTLSSRASDSIKRANIYSEESYARRAGVMEEQKNNIKDIEDTFKEIDTEIESYGFKIDYFKDKLAGSFGANSEVLMDKFAQIDVNSRARINSFKEMDTYVNKMQVDKHVSDIKAQTEDMIGQIKKLDIKKLVKDLTTDIVSESSNQQEIDAFNRNQALAQDRYVQYMNELIKTNTSRTQVARGNDDAAVKYQSPDKLVEAMVKDLSINGKVPREVEQNLKLLSKYVANSLISVNSLEKLTYKYENTEQDFSRFEDSIRQDDNLKQLKADDPESYKRIMTDINGTKKHVKDTYKAVSAPEDIETHFNNRYNAVERYANQLLDTNNIRVMKPDFNPNNEAGKVAMQDAVEQGYKMIAVPNVEDGKINVVWVEEKENISGTMHGIDWSGKVFESDADVYNYYAQNKVYGIDLDIRYDGDSYIVDSYNKSPAWYVNDKVNAISTNNALVSFGQPVSAQSIERLTSLISNKTADLNKIEDNMLDIESKLSVNEDFQSVVDKGIVSIKEVDNLAVSDESLKLNPDSEVPINIQKLVIENQYRVRRDAYVSKVDEYAKLNSTIKQHGDSMRHITVEQVNEGSYTFALGKGGNSMALKVERLSYEEYKNINPNETDNALIRSYNSAPIYKVQASSSDLDTARPIIMDPNHEMYNTAAALEASATKSSGVDINESTYNSFLKSNVYTEMIKGSVDLSEAGIRVEESILRNNPESPELVKGIIEAAKLPDISKYNGDNPIIKAIATEVKKQDKASRLPGEVADKNKYTNGVNNNKFLNNLNTISALLTGKINNLHNISLTSDGDVEAITKLAAALSYPRAEHNGNFPTNDDWVDMEMESLKVNEVKIDESLKLSNEKLTTLNADKRATALHYSERIQNIRNQIDLASNKVDNETEVNKLSEMSSKIIKEYELEINKRDVEINKVSEEIKSQEAEKVNIELRNRIVWNSGSQEYLDWAIHTWKAKGQYTPYVSSAKDVNRDINVGFDEFKTEGDGVLLSAARSYDVDNRNGKGPDSEVIASVDYDFVDMKSVDEYRTEVKGINDIDVELTGSLFEIINNGRRMSRIDHNKGYQDDISKSFGMSMADKLPYGTRGAIENFQDETMKVIDLMLYNTNGMDAEIGNKLSDINKSNVDIAKQELNKSVYTDENKPNKKVC